MRRVIPTILLIFVAACGQATTPGLPTVQVTPSPLSPTQPPTATVMSSSDIAQIAATSAVSTTSGGTVRIVHAAPNTPTINVLSGIEAIATNLDFTQVSEPTPLSAGSHPIRVVASSSRPNDAPLYETTFSLQANEASIVVIGRDGDAFKVFSFVQAVEPLNGSESIITVANAISGTNGIEVQTGDGAVIDALPYGEAQTTRILPSGETTLNLVAGENQSHSLDITLDGGHHYTLILTGTLDNISVASFSSVSPGRTNVRALNASELLPAIDVYVDGQLITENAAFGRPTNRTTIRPGRYTVSVYETGSAPSTDNPLYSQIIDVSDNKNLSLILLGTTDEITIVPYEEDLSPTPAGQTRITFLNTLANVPTLHVETTGGPISDLPDMSFGQSPVTARFSEGSHTFYLTRIGGSSSNQTVENAPDVQLEAGIVYLYLPTGRLDEQPVIISERVGIDESLAIRDTALRDTENPPHVRFVNAIDNPLLLEFRVNDVPVASDVGHRQGSDFFPIMQQEASISVVEATNDTFLQLVDYPLEGGSYYTVVAHGFDVSHIELTVISDDELIFDGRSPHVRLINLSGNMDSTLGLGFSPQDPTPEAEVTADLETDIRRSIPAGIQRLVNDIAGGTISPAILMPAGIFDMEILDTVTNQLATTVTNVRLESGGHYDIFAYEEPETTRIRAFVVPYPPRSD